ncbi:MAG: hypothetical protein IJ864_01545 [Alphaproteobacteria bacterium]|nr:hypothetical protein [Alphaproteobacteria bacterium]
MLNISFFITSFTTIFWIIYSAKLLNLKDLATTNTETLYYAIMIIVLPIAVLWGILALIKNLFADRTANRYIYNMLSQVQKNVEQTATLEQLLIDKEDALKKGFVIQEFNLLVSDINEILSDIIKRSNSVSSAQLEHLWSRTIGGERWIMAKTFIEITNYQPEFINHLTTKANKDSLLKGSILEFHARYKTIQTLLNENDNQKIFYNMVEYGALGKVFNILTPVAQNLSITPPQNNTLNQNHPPLKQPVDFNLTEETFSIPSFLSQEENETSAIYEPTLSQQSMEKSMDSGLRAIREELLNSTPTTAEKKEFSPTPPRISSFTKTQQALHNIKVNAEKKYPEPPKIKKQTPVISLAEIDKEINASPENNYDEYAYPFGTWSNEKKEL